MYNLFRLRFTAVLSLGIVFAMIGASYAAVPLYRLFCQVTGFSGTTQRADSAPGPISEKTIRIQFDSNVNSGLDWRFSPTQREINVIIGEKKLAFYQAQNLSTKTLTGTAVFNVTPVKAGYFFNKIDCFCFSEQVLKPGEVVDMPVSFFIDPAILDDPNMQDVRIITLSYTFFAKKPELSEKKAKKLSEISKNTVILPSNYTRQRESELRDG